MVILEVLSKAKIIVVALILVVFAVVITSILAVPISTTYLIEDINGATFDSSYRIGFQRLLESGEYKDDVMTNLGNGDEREKLIQTMGAILKEYPVGIERDDANDTRQHTDLVSWWNNNCSSIGTASFSTSHCAMTVSWIYSQAFGVERGFPESGEDQLWANGWSCDAIFNWFNEQGCIKFLGYDDYVPQTGDILFWDYNNSGSTVEYYTSGTMSFDTLDHVGLVRSYDASTGALTTLEGNMWGSWSGYKISTWNSDGSLNTSSDIIAVACPNFK